MSITMSKEEFELATLFSQHLSFNDANIKELEKATRGQSASRHWMNQRQGRITASNFHDLHTKVKKLLGNGGTGGKIKVSPILANLLEHNDLTYVPAIRWEKCMKKMLVKCYLLAQLKFTQTQISHVWLVSNEGPSLHQCKSR